MNPTDVMLNPPKYMDIVATYDLDLKGGDLQVTPEGDIAVTADGDLKFGNDRVNAMHRLIQRWCYNVPIISVLFDLVVYAGTASQNLRTELDLLMPIAFSGADRASRFHEINDEIGASGFGGAACAGTIMVVLNSLLMRYKLDLEADDDKWERSGPLFQGCSFGAVVAAAAANFRHHDEWARTNPPSKQQLRSIAVISAVLKRPIAPDGARHPFRHNVCQELLNQLTDGLFDRLGESTFGFAKMLAN